MSQNLAFDFVDDQTLPDLIDGSANPNKYYTGRTKDGDMIYTGDILVSDVFKLTSANTDLGDLGSNGEWSPSSTPSVRVFKTQTSQGDGDTHLWLDDGSDGMRSFSNDVAYPTENYSIAGAIPDPLDNRAFTTASSGQPYEKYGNLYNWTAATLGTGIGRNANEDATASICPKGWRLPANGDNIAPAQDGTIKSYLNLIRNYDNAYGTTGANNTNTTINIASFGEDFGKMTDGDYIGPVALTSSQSSINAYNQLAEFPLNFLRTGNYDHSNGNEIARTTDGLWWSSTATTDMAAFSLMTWISDVYTQGGGDRGRGFAIRCVAQ